MTANHPLRVNWAPPPSSISSCGGSRWRRPRLTSRWERRPLRAPR
jgi:hypothetical protein